MATQSAMSMSAYAIAMSPQEDPFSCYMTCVYGCGSPSRPNNKSFRVSARNTSTFLAQKLNFWP